jgi:hypothetical protein
MNRSRGTSSSTPLSQNIPAREVVQALLSLPVPRGLDIALLRPNTRQEEGHFETVAEARTRQETALERFDQISGMAEVGDRLFLCSDESHCAEVNCPICARSFRRWFVAQALRHQRDIDLEVVTVGIESVPRTELPDVDVGVLKRRVAQRIRRAAPSADFVLGGIEADYKNAEDGAARRASTARGEAN